MVCFTVFKMPTLDVVFMSLANNCWSLLHFMETYCSHYIMILLLGTFLVMLFGTNFPLLSGGRLPMLTRLSILKPVLSAMLARQSAYIWLVNFILLLQHELGR